jgi:hypothetical protein
MKKKHEYQRIDVDCRREMGGRFDRTRRDSKEEVSLGYRGGVCDPCWAHLNRGREETPHPLGKNGDRPITPRYAGSGAGDFR